MTFNSWRRSTNKENRFKFGGKEEQEEWGVIDFGARMYMADIGRWGVVDPLSERYITGSPYAFVMNNPLRNQEIDGRYFDEKNEKKAARMEKRIGKKAAKLGKKARKLAAKGKDILNVTERLEELGKSAQDVGDMRGSETEFRFEKSNHKSNTVRDTDGNGLPVTMKTGENQVTMFMDKKFNFHEPRHGGQVARGEYGFNAGGNPDRRYGASHEISAYRAQLAYSGSISYVPGIDLTNVGNLMQLGQGTSSFKITLKRMSGVNNNLLRKMVDRPGLMQQYIYRDYPSYWWNQ